jgi:hypothetical protein
MPAQPINNHIASEHFILMAKPSEILFDEKQKNLPEFEHRLLNEAENPNIGWNQELLNFQLMDKTTKPFNVLEGYFNIRETMLGALQDDLQWAKQEDLMKPASQLYRLHSLKTTLKNCPTPDLTRNIETSIPTGISNKNGRTLLVKIVSHTFLDKEAHKRIIYKYILKLEITESNNMGGFQRELSSHIKQYDAIQGNEWKKITNHLIRQYHKIELPPFQTGFNIRFLAGPKEHMKYEWLCTPLEWTNITCHDLTTHNLRPNPETSNIQEINPVPMHEK